MGEALTSYFGKRRTPCGRRTSSARTDYGLISDCLDETRTARGSVLGIDSNFAMNPLKHFVAQHRADTDFADCWGVAPLRPYKARCLGGSFG